MKQEEIVMDEKNLEYREELDRRISILTENGKKIVLLNNCKP